MQNKEETILREIVWGERPIHHLSFLKIKFEQTESGYRVENTRDLRVEAGPADVARGILRHYQEPKKLAEWARGLLEISECFFLNLESGETGKTLLAVLHNAVAQKPLSEKALNQAKVLVPAFPKKRFLGEPKP